MRTRQKRRARHFITIRRDSSNAGDLNPNYTGNPVVRNAPARHYDTDGSSTFRGEQISETVASIFEIREPTSERIVPRMLVQFDSRTFPIENVKRNYGPPTNTVLLMCREEQ